MRTFLSNLIVSAVSRGCELIFVLVKHRLAPRSRAAMLGEINSMPTYELIY